MGMAKPHVLVALEKQYAVALSRYQRAELATETIVGLKALEEEDRRIQAERRVLQEKMDQITHLIRLQVDPQWTPDHIKPLHERSQRRRGSISKLAWKVLRASSEPMKAREITRLIAPQLGVDAADHRAIVRIDSKVHAALKTWLSEGDAEKVDEKPSRWRARCRGWARRHVSVAAASVPLRRDVGGDREPRVDASANSLPSPSPVRSEVLPGVAS